MGERSKGRGLGGVPSEEAVLVDIREFIYPHYDEVIERELREHGITKAYSFGNVELRNGLRALGKGKTGVVVLTEDFRALKIRRTDSPKEGLEIEAKIQLMAYPVSPRVYDFGKNFILMEFIKGRHITRQDLHVLPALVVRAWELEMAKVEHKELSRPWKNVVLKEDGTVVILDYDSASVKESPKNVTSVLSAFGFGELAKYYAKTRDLRYVLYQLKPLSSSHDHDVAEVRNL